jgi:hypothetical protein
VLTKILGTNLKLIPFEKEKNKIKENFLSTEEKYLSNNFYTKILIQNYIKIIKNIN